MITTTTKNPARREIHGAGVNGSGTHVFTCRTIGCNGGVVYRTDGKRAGHFKLIASPRPFMIAWLVTSRCPGTRKVAGVVITADTFNEGYPIAVERARVIA